MMKKIIALTGIAVLMFSCNIAQQVLETYQLTQCKYDYNSISGLTLAGINLQGSTNSSALNPLHLAALTTAFSSKDGSLPLSFTLNLDVANPGIQTALLNGLEYVLEIDSREMTAGSLEQKLQIDGGKKAVLPIKMSFDLKKTLSGESLESIKNLAFNFAGIGNKPSNVTVRLKPNMMIGNHLIPSPSYIPITFQIKK
ncbi:MAG: hypothetical protein LBH61_01875 [Dysgonamonadaceae bacterium]|jgi:hypothetical protein|nr:hypothetical protein [Dysgonamonadaceae bacterium]